MVIVPTELITDNGSKLESIVLELAHINNLDFRFIEWLENSNTFCNSLVNRIVPSKPNAEEAARIEAALGYSDELMTMSEVFRLWAIEGNEKLKRYFPSVRQMMVWSLHRILPYSRNWSCACWMAHILLIAVPLSSPVSILHGMQWMIRCMVSLPKTDAPEIAPSIPYTIEEKVKADLPTILLNGLRIPLLIINGKASLYSTHQKWKWGMCRCC